MAKINLLPWREELRKERQRQFLSVLGLVFALGVVVVFSYKYTISLEIDAQQGRNDFLNREIKGLESKIKEIEALEKERQQLIDRMNMITDLQKSRPKVVRIFDELTRSVPEGLNLRSVGRRNSALTIRGSAESSQRVTAFMRNIEGSQWFANPNLKGIDADEQFGAGRKAFTLVTQESSPDDGMGEDEEESL